MSKLYRLGTKQIPPQLDFTNPQVKHEKSTFL